MVEMTQKETETSHWWWFDPHHRALRSPWLQSTLGELDNKTKAMLKLIEADADSFAQRAEMYYKKRPELINMVEDFYRAHRSLAERYDQLKSDSGNRLLSTFSSPSSIKHQLHKFVCGMDLTYDSHSEIYDLESAESEVDDPEQEVEIHPDEELGEVKEAERIILNREVPEVSGGVSNDEVIELQEEIEKLKEQNRIQKEQLLRKDEEKREVTRQLSVALEVREVLGRASNDEVIKLQEEIERLNEQNRIQKEQLLQKDEEKREVIRQLSLAMEVLKLENVKLRKCVARASPKKRSPFEFEKLKEVFSGKLFNGSPNSRLSLIAL